MTRARAYWVLGTAYLLAVSVCSAELMAHLSIRRMVTGRLGWEFHDLIWNTPLSYMAYLALPLVLAVAAIARRPEVGLRLALAGYASLVALSALILFPRVSQWASLALALGVGVQVWRWTERGLARRTRYMPHFAAGAVLSYSLLVAATLVSRTARGGARGGGEMAAGGEISARGPNVVLLIWDTVRAKSLSVHQPGRAPTPHLQNLAAEGIRFDHAFSNAPWTLPSHASFFTGVLPGELSADWTTPLDGALPTIAEVLSRHGWETVGLTGNRFYTGRRTGLDRGFSTYRENRRTVRQVLYSSSFGQTLTMRRIVKYAHPSALLTALRDPDFSVDPAFAQIDKYYARHVTDDFLAWTAARDTTRPFFAFLNFFDAHETEDLTADEAMVVEGAPDRLGRYERSITHLDSLMGRMVETLRTRGELDNTVFIVSSDHGEHFGEHGLNAKHGVSLYEATLHVPLVIRLPNRQHAGVVIGQQVELRDLPATVLDLAGVARERMPGRSLRRFVSDPAFTGDTLLAEVSARINEREDVPNRLYGLKAIRTDSLLYIRRRDGREEAFAWRTDRDESNDILQLRGRDVEVLRTRLLQHDLPWR